MHTSTRLSSTDFQFWQYAQRTAQPSDFATFCPDYHELDRVGVVSPCLEDGVRQSSYALLALTTAFYDCLRARSDNFFDYPQHFAFVGAQATGIHTGGGLLPADTPKLWDGWSWLDVWPAAKWVTAPATAASMLQRVFDYQINRLFWPRALKPAPHETALPAYAWQMLQTRLKAVYYYGPAEPAAGQLELRVSPAANALAQESLERLPAALNLTSAQPPPTQCYQPIPVAEFLAAMQRKIIDIISI